MTDDDRKAAYNADITYGTASEFGFDFLRDRLKIKSGAGRTCRSGPPGPAHGQEFKPLDPKVQRGHHYALVDEADNIFVDEARTPLIISIRAAPGHGGGSRSSTTGPTSWPRR